MLQGHPQLSTSEATTSYRIPERKKFESERRNKEADFVKEMLSKTDKTDCERNMLFEMCKGTKEMIYCEIYEYN